MHVLALLLAAAPAADLVLINGKVFTLDPAQPWAEAVAISGERIAFVGRNAQARKRAAPRARVIDLKQAFVVPGFHDGHVHVDETGALLVGVNLLEVHEATAFTKAIAAAAARLPRGSWITGDYGAYEAWAKGSAGDGKGAAPAFRPDRSLIDPGTPEHPVFVSRYDGTLHLANRRALELAGLDPKAHPTGLVQGADAEKIRAAIAEPDLPLRLIQLRSALREAKESGVTSIQDGYTTPEQLRAYQELHRQGELTARILARPSLDKAPAVKELGIGRDFGDGYLKVAGYKAWVDGIMGGSSALFFEPYDHQPKNAGKLRPIMFPEGRDGAGMSMSRQQRYTDSPPGNLERLLRVAADTGLPPHVHAIGDKGNRILLDVFERVLTETGKLKEDHRWRVIHAQVVDPPDFERFGRMKLVAEVNPYHVSDDMRWMEERIGKKRCEGAYAFRTLKTAGAVLVFGSDSPGTNAARYYLNPVYGLYAAVSRQTLDGKPEGGWFPEQRLTIEEALDAYIRAPAWAAFEENDKGTLAAGKLADIAVFDRDLVAAGRASPRQLLDAKVLYTLVGGKVVYEAQR